MSPELGGPWYSGLTREHWFVLIVAALGWLFDTMDQQLFTLARVPAMRALLPDESGAGPSKELIAAYSGYVTSIFIIGWATGGLVFGMLGDRFGRARVMAWTILIYSAFTGLSAFSTNFWDFAFYRFLTGIGVGGEFAVGVTLVAEVMPPRARPFALGLLQALSAVGNMTAALIGIGMGQLTASNLISDSWRWMFVIGALPALLVVIIRRHLKEPEAWTKAVSGGQARKAGSYGELFQTPVLRRNAIIGLLLAVSGVIGLWGIGFFAVDLFDSVFREAFTKKGLDEISVTGRVDTWKGILMMMQNIGGFLGMYSFAFLSEKFGRRPVFAFAFLAAAAMTLVVFSSLNDLNDVFWMIPLMGFFQFMLFGGYAVYFPELFPTRLRSTGTSFCYNVGRYIAALGPSALGVLTGVVFAGSPQPMRPAGMVMCSVFAVGLIAIMFAPETKDQPLPE